MKLLQAQNKLTNREWICTWIQK